MSVCRQIFFKSPLLLQCLSDSHEHDICANMEKIVEQILKILILKFLAIFLIFLNRSSQFFSHSHKTWQT